MQPIHIFKAGTHTDMRGVRITFGEAELRDMAAAYDPALHEAPLVVGHPATDAPSYGGVAALSYASDGLYATPADVDPAFAELVRAKRFGKVSASIYLPDSPSNPRPGSYYLRHVGFLGAQPPAIKGLKPIAFAEGEDGVVEFADLAWLASTNASLWRGLRDWLLTQFGAEAADRVAPDYQVNALQAEALRAADERSAAASTTPAYSEGTPPVTTTDNTQAEAAELARQRAALKADTDKLAAEQAAFAEQRAAHDAAAKAQRDAEAIEFCDALVQAGQLPPALKGRAVALLQQAAPEAVLSFAETDGAAPLQASVADTLKGLLKALPKAVDFGEAAPAGKGSVAPDLSDHRSIATAATAYQEAQRKSGQDVSFEQAVQAVADGLA